MSALLPRLCRNERGATVVEFGLILVPLMAVLLGLTDLGFQHYLSEQLQGTLDEAAREVTVGGVPQSQIQTLLERRIHSIWQPATVTLKPQSFDNFSHVGKPEPITTDTNGNGTLDPGDCFLDVNNNGRWDSNTIGTTGTGGGDDIVYYLATVTFPEIMPVSSLLGWSDTTTISTTMMMRNQPYAAQLPPHTICR